MHCFLSAEIFLEENKWNRLTDLRGEEDGEDGKSSAKEYICIYAYITHGHKLMW